MSDHGLSSIRKHEHYYLRDGNICFLVEKTLFRLHRYFIERESDYFRTLLDSKDEDGSPNRPYILHDVKNQEFADFVWVWYNPRYSFSEQDKQKWLTILRLATQWRFDQIRQLAIRQLEKLALDPIEKISTYKEYLIDDKLLIPSYVSLCRREKLPSPDEGRKLTLETVLKLATAREQAILTASEQGCKTPTTAGVPEAVVQAVVTEVFELTLRSNMHPKEGQTMNSGGTLSGNFMDTEVATKSPADSKKKASGPRHFSQN